MDVNLAGLRVPCRFRYPETAKDFRSSDSAAQRVVDCVVSISDEEWRSLLAEGLEDCAHTEYSLLTAYFSDALMEYDRMILHGVALRWKDQAYLICAKSGVGKSTQARNLQALRPGEFGVICGDRPIVSFHAGCIEICPSPWNGKENWHGAEAAPLAGVILLQRGEENRIEVLRPRQAALRAYAQVLQTCTNPKTMEKAAELLTKLLNSVPIWQLTSFQVPDSTKLLLNTVFS